MLMGVFSYIADITTEEDRTLRIGILNVCFTAGVPIGLAFSGVLLKKIGFYGIFSISASLYLIAFAYGLFFLHEPRSAPTNSVEKGERRSLLSDFFDRQLVVDTLKVAFKRGENQRRQRVVLLMIVVMLLVGPPYGEMGLNYLFMRFHFNWSEVEYSFFSTFVVVIGLMGVLFCVGILSHKLQIDDALVSVLSSMSKIMACFVYAFAAVPWQMYAGSVVEIFYGAAFIAMRSIATKLVCKDELGKVNFGVVETLIPMVFVPMYTTLYVAMLQVLPGVYHLLSAAFIVSAVAIFLWMYRFQRRQLHKRQDAESASKPPEPAGQDNLQLVATETMVVNEPNDVVNAAFAPVPEESTSLEGQQTRF